MKPNKINSIANFINRSPKTQNLLKKINKNPSLYTMGASAILSGVLRPTTIYCLPFDQNKDRQYSVASSVAGAVTEIASSALVFIPLTSSLKKASDNLYKAEGTVYHNNPKILRGFKNYSNRAIKFALFLPLAMARFGMVRPLVDTLFKKETKVNNENTKNS